MEISTPASGRKYRLTTFKTKGAKTKEEIEATLDDMGRMVLEEHASDKTKLRWWKFARFGDKATESGCLRHDANVIAITGIELDYDKMELGFEEACGRCRDIGLKALIYTSPSHTPEKPRWRVMLPTSEELDPSERKELAEAADDLFGGIASPESLTLSQSFYFGYVIGHEATHRIFVHNGGAYINDLVRSDGPNNFTRQGEIQIIPLVDVDEKLSSMRYQSGEVTGIHNTQLSVTASLLCAGVDIDEAVDKVLAATRIAAEGLNWDWDREERRIRKMCTDWQKKQDREGKTVAVVRNGKKVRVAKGELHEAIAAVILSRINGDDRGLLRTGGQWWRCEDNIWRIADSGVVADWLGSETRDVCDELKTTPTRRLAGEVQHAILTSCNHDRILWDAHGKLATMSGLVDEAGELEPLRAEHYTTRRLTVEYRPDANCPKWKAALRACVGKDEANLIQEVAGAALHLKKSKAETRALVLVGPSNSGKTTIADVLAKLLSTTTIGTPIEAVDGAHGTVAFHSCGYLCRYSCLDESCDRTTRRCLRFS